MTEDDLINGNFLILMTEDDLINGNFSFFNVNEILIC